MTEHVTFEYLDTSQLTERDIDLAHQQCEIQGATSPEQIEGMVSALATAKEFAHSQEPLTVETITNLALKLAGQIEPDKAATWRNVPVTFRSGDRGERPENIPHAISAWAEAFADSRLEPTEVYYYFEKIHPFEDGNGRIGHCLWAIAVTRQTSDWPETLPPDVFVQGYEQPMQSAFGEIEA